MSTEVKSAMFDSLKMRFDKNFVRKDQLQKYAELGKITAKEYEIITGQEFEVI